jgi:GTP-binding protein
MKILTAKYIGSIAGPGEKMVDEPEVCFIGRSNVGKSSMINRLVMQKVARTSSTPGATRMINIFRVYYEHAGERRWTVFSDFPGFGYAKVSKQAYSTWENMIERYISEKGSRKMIIWVYDVRREFDALDQMVLEWIGERKLEMTFVLTKVDKVSRQEIHSKKNRWAEIFGDDQVVMFSSKDGQGRDNLLSNILKFLGHTN